MKRYFLTGTDTDAGKTLISAALLQRAVLDGHTSFGLKPIASGSDQTDSGLRNRDALLHQKYSSGNLTYEVHNPITLKPAIAPHIAAKEAGLSLTCSSLIEACENGLTQTADLQLIEGAGGWLVPLNDTETLADFAASQNLPVILVIGLKLGCINHACLTVEAIRQCGLTIAGWVANSIDPDMEAQQENLRYLTQWFHQRGIQHLGTVPHIRGIDPFDEESLKQVSDRLQWPD
ncbi:dethiobiotin synthetase [Thalassolituus maritimus]|uniref:ATP-dependent dethiobiotin synthetase BioD n=1 Tax=Thalassolituus maritimus TaxID=484498 RepID=A0A1N7J0L4_9GAMM|nr:dethiobiotin synthase [Thalassolituus maritimus]SIS42893.1 dethiobiotin synthetase [Thalassolituus maritimus]